MEKKTMRNNLKKRNIITERMNRKVEFLIEFKFIINDIFHFFNISIIYCIKINIFILISY